MPVWRYFLWVGGGLLALLFVVDVYLPRQPPRTEAHHTYNIPIAAALVGSEPVTFSGETLDFGSPPPMVVVDFSSRTQRTTEANAQMIDAQIGSAQASAKLDVKPTRPKVAKRKINRERDFAPVPDAWSRDRYSGMAFARPSTW